MTAHKRARWTAISKAIFIYADKFKVVLPQLSVVELIKTPIAISQVFSHLASQSTSVCSLVYQHGLLSFIEKY